MDNNKEKIKIKGDEPKMPDPKEADQEPEVDMSNEIKKGGEPSKEK